MLRTVVILVFYISSLAPPLFKCYRSIARVVNSRVFARLGDPFGSLSAVVCILQFSATSHLIPWFCASRVCPLVLCKLVWVVLSIPDPSCFDGSACVSLHHSFQQLFVSFPLLHLCDEEILCGIYRKMSVKYESEGWNLSILTLVGSSEGDLTASCRWSLFSAAVYLRPFAYLKFVQELHIAVLRLYSLSNLRCGKLRACFGRGYIFAFYCHDIGAFSESLFQQFRCEEMWAAGGMFLAILSPFTHLDVYIYQFTQFKYLHSVLVTKADMVNGRCALAVGRCCKRSFAFHPPLVAFTAEIPDRVSVSGHMVGRFYLLTTPSSSCWWVSEVDSIRDLDVSASEPLPFCTPYPVCQHVCIDSVQF